MSAANLERWDVIIVGAGPAGAAAALAAADESSGARVLLLDRCAFPRDKVCGDGIAPHVFDLLAALGVPPATFADYPPIPGLWLTGPRGGQVRGLTQRPARVIPRTVFDARLVAAAADRGVCIRQHRVRRLTISEQGVCLDGRLQAAVVIAADGATSTVRRLLGLPAPPAGSCAVAMRAYARTGDEGDGWTQRIVFDSRSGRRPALAYAWHFPTGTGVANVGYGVVPRPGEPPVTRAMLRAGVPRLLGGEFDDGPAAGAHRGAHPTGAPHTGAPTGPLTGAPHTGLDLRGIDEATARGALLPLSSWRPHQPDGPVVLIGDAASLVNPLTGEGIFDAVASGMLAGRLAVASLATRRHSFGARFRQQWHQRTNAHGWQVRSVARYARPWLLDRGVRAAAADRRVFDALVEMGLAHGTLSPRIALSVAGLLPRPIGAGPAGRSRAGRARSSGGG